LGGLRFKASPGNKSETLSQKYLAPERTDGVVQMVGHLPSKHEALNSNPRAAKKKKIELVFL
jgi:hypothetical protein